MAQGDDDRVLEMMIMEMLGIEDCDEVRSQLNSAKEGFVNWMLIVWIASMWSSETGTYIPVCQLRLGMLASMQRGTTKSM